MNRKMHKVIALLSIVAMLFTIVPATLLFSANADGDNLIQNGSFESGTSGWSIGGTTATSTDAKEGSTALLIQHTTMYGEAAAQVVNVTTNTNYTISWWTKRVSGSDAYCLFVMNNAGYANINPTEGEIWFNQTSTDWVQKTIKINSGDATAILLKFGPDWTAAGGSFLVDDVVMTAEGGSGGGSSTEVPFTNGDFETGDTTGWEKWQNTTVDAAAAHTGSYGAHLLGLGSWNGLLNQTFDTEAGKTYIVSFWYKVNKNAITVQFKDSATWGSVIASGSLATTTEWTKYEKEVTAVSNKVVLNFSGNGGTGDPNPAKAEDAYIDDVVITLKGGSTPDPEPEPDDGELVKNGSFEKGDKDWALNGAASVVDGGHTGDKALQITNPGAWSEAAKQTIDVKTDTTYYITVWSKRVSGTGAFNLIPLTASSTNMTIVSGQSWFNETSGNWVETVIEVNTGSSDKLTLKFTAEAANAGIILFDDIAVAEKAKPLEGQIVNGDFETGDATGWNTVQSTTVSSAAKKNGAYGIHLKGNSDWGGLLDQTFDVVDGKTYIASFWCKINGTVGVNTQWIGTTSGTQYKQDGVNNYLEPGKYSDWTQYVLEFTVSGDTQIKLNFCGDGSTNMKDLYIDDIQVVEKTGGSTPEPDSTFVNGGFETGDLTGWSGFQSTAVSTDAKRSGSYGAHLKGAGSWGGLLDQEFEVENGKTYDLTFWYKVNNDSGFNYKVKGNANLASGSGTAKEWTKVTLTFTADKNKLLLNISGYGATGDPDPTKAEDVYVDDFILTEKADTPPPVGLEEFQNGDFETGDFTGWTKYQDTAISADAAYGESAYGAHLKGKGWGGMLTQTFKTETGTKYHLIFRYYNNENGFNFQVKDQGDAGTNLVGQWCSKNKVWTKVAVEFVAASDVTFLNFAGGGETMTSDFYLDEVALYKDGEQPGANDPNLIKNGSFEEGIDNWNVSGDTAIYEKDYTDGTHSLKLSQDKGWAEAATQVVKVQPNTDYVLKWWHKRDTGKGQWMMWVMENKPYDYPNIGSEKGTGTISGNQGFDQTDRSTWYKNVVEINTGDATELLLKFGPNADNCGTFLVDGVGLYVKGTEPVEPEPEPVPPPLELSDYFAKMNRPGSQEKNLIVNGSFESTEDANWNVDTFLNDNTYFVDDSTTPYGDRSLYFNTSGVEDKVMSVFWVELEKQTEYTFSTWLKGAFISDENRFNATVGVVDKNGQFLTMDFDPENANHGEFMIGTDRDGNDVTGTRQIVPPAWDNEWHLRAVSFTTGEDTKFGIALYGSQSQLWLDDMALYKNGDGVAYISDNMSYSMKMNFDTSNIGCDANNSLIPDPNFNNGANSDFWQKANGWYNGFLSFEENPYEFGTSLKYTAKYSNGMTATRWVSVKPNTEYTFSMNLRILESGLGSLVLLDGKIRECARFFQAEFDQVVYDNPGWQTICIKFNTGCHTTIGIGIVDGGGIALLDNMRLFESDKGKDVEDTFIDPPVEAGDDFEDELLDDYDDGYYDDDSSNLIQVIKKGGKKARTIKPIFVLLAWIAIGAAAAALIVGFLLFVFFMSKLLIKKSKEKKLAAVRKAL